jgi:hypothetical protein
MVISPESYYDARIHEYHIYYSSFTCTVLHWIILAFSRCLILLAALRSQTLWFSISGWNLIIFTSCLQNMEETRSIKIAQKIFRISYKSFGRTVTSGNCEHEDCKIVLNYEKVHYLSYRLEGPAIESRWGARFSSPVQTGPGAHPASCTMGTGSFLRVKSGRVVTLTSHPLLVPWSWKSRAIPLLSLWAVRRVEPQCLYKGALYPYITFQKSSNSKWKVQYYLYKTVTFPFVYGCRTLSLALRK